MQHFIPLERDELLPPNDDQKMHRTHQNQNSQKGQQFTPLKRGEVLPPNVVKKMYGKTTNPKPTKKDSISPPLLRGVKCCPLMLTRKCTEHTKAKTHKKCCLTKAFNYCGRGASTLCPQSLLLKLMLF